MPVESQHFANSDLLQTRREQIRVKRPFARFIGVDLGGGRGKTTVVAELRSGADRTVEVFEVATRAGKQRWTDDALVERLTAQTPGGVIAIDAPLTQTACARCTRSVCPGTEACAEPAVEWLRTTGRQLVEAVSAESAIEGGGPSRARARRDHVSRVRLAPHTHRATDIVMTYQRDLLPISSLGAANSAVASRAAWLRKRLCGAGYELHHNLIEVSPAATITALCGSLLARGYKRDADPWRTRAAILTRFTDLTFAPQSRMAREEVLSNDHCFDAVIAAYTAFRWARDGWNDAAGLFCDDGWIVAPP